MKVVSTGIEDLCEIEPRVFGDERGYFYESYNKQLYTEKSLDMEFVQDNQSLSARGVLRGLHFQNPPHEQGKLVRVVKGAVLDVAVDIRLGSPTYGKHHKVVLSEQNKKMFWIPPGFAHGFLTLEDETVFCYKCTSYYNKESEGSIFWNDPELEIDWEYADPVLSEKDRNARPFSELKSKFHFTNEQIS